MPRFSTIPTIYDECKQINISDLKRWGFLNPGQWKRGSMNWYAGDQKTGSVSLLVDTSLGNSFLELNYTTNGNPIEYRVDLVTIPSNLGKGHLWYFLCPVVGRRCRNLYLFGGRFLHREAISGFYEKQVQSKRYRSLDRTFGKAFRTEDAWEEMQKRYFKKHYNGRPTRRYLRLLKKVNLGME